MQERTAAKAAAAFIEDEAELSRDARDVSDDSEDDDVIDAYDLDDSFVNDASVASQRALPGFRYSHLPQVCAE